MPRIIILICSVLIMFLNNSVYSQKWGKVSKEELNMSSFPKVPGADALILFDIGEIEIVDFDLVFKRHYRMKILTEEGKEYADFRIKYWHEDKIRKLDVQTFLPNGKKIKLKGKEIFDEESDRFKYKVFAFPAVEIGSVLEFRYELFSDYITFLEPWRFQNEIYTKMSRLSVILQPGFSYDVFFNNSVGFDPEPEVEEFLIPGVVARTGQKFIWKVEDLEPVKKQPYITTIYDYVMTMYFQLVTYKSPYVYHKYIKTWDDMAKRISDHYKDLLSDDNGLQKAVIEMTSNDSSDIDKAKKIYNFVCKSIESDGYKWLFPDKKPHEIFEKMKGSANEKNILLINLLRHIGLHADPVIISTRSNGRINEVHPSLQQFNRVIVQLEVNNKIYHLDSEDKYCPFNTLPPSDIVAKGLLVHEDSGEIISLPEQKNVNTFNISSEGAINKEGVLSCNSKLIYDGYLARSERKELSNTDPSEYIGDKLKERFREINVDTFKITGLDSTENPLKIEVTYQVPNFVELTGDMVYLPSPIIEKLESNPFKSEKRNFPVEYNYSYSSSEIFKLKIPENLTIIEQPNMSRQMHKGLSFSNSVQFHENEIKFERYYSRTSNFYNPIEYKSLRDIFAKIVSTDDGVVVFSKEDI